jgi:hypothetical protein
MTARSLRMRAERRIKVRGLSFHMARKTGISWRPDIGAKIVDKKKPGKSPGLIYHEI